MRFISVILVELRQTSKLNQLFALPIKSKNLVLINHTNEKEEEKRGKISRNGINIKKSENYLARSNFNPLLSSSIFVLIFSGYTHQNYQSD